MDVRGGDPVASTVDSGCGWAGTSVWPDASDGVGRPLVEEMLVLRRDSSRSWLMVRGLGAGEVPDFSDTLRERWSSLALVSRSSGASFAVSERKTPSATARVRGKRGKGERQRQRERANSMQ